MNPTIIEDVRARKIVDSRGNWTIEVDVITRFGFGRCAAPSGASVGKYEVIAFPENDVDKAIVEIEESVCPELIGMDAEEQENIDAVLKEVDGTNDFSNIGGNAALALSLANAKAAANAFGMPLYQYLGGNLATEIPYPLGNAIGGGRHAIHGPDIQEFLVLPIGAESILDALRVNTMVYKRVGAILSARGIANFGRGDEGAWAPGIDDMKALKILSEARAEVQEETGIELRLGMDVAAGELWDEKKGMYTYKREGVDRTREEQIEHIVEIIEENSLYYVEDPLEENDFDGFSELSEKADCLICGDDLYVTNVKRINDGAKKRSTNAVLIKPNQCGTMTDTFKAVKVAKNNHMVPVISHRSGETTDNTISHLAVAFGCPIIKTGIVGGERIAKLNELVRISEELTAQRAKMAAVPD
jgi:enolase